jgi:methylenetetrahydrofolate dehydrogenase (NADP+)/methenyltetrahydrofolate cyclohydrolase
MAFANLIDGRAIAEQIHAETIQRISALKARGLNPGLTFVRVGEDPASRVYVGMKEKACQRLGIQSQTHVLPQSISQAELLALLRQLNADPRVHGILVQAPRPPPHPAPHGQ